MTKTHYWKDGFHFQWNPALEPELRVGDGDVVVYELPEVCDGQITADSVVDVLSNLDWNRVYALAGPVEVSGAEPGDTLEVEVLDVHTHGWGWTGVLPGFGLLTEDFPDPHLHIWQIPDGRYAYLADVARIPLHPFCGTMGVCPDVKDPQPVMPPGHFGGNLDCRDLTRGSRLFLPVQVSGARFSVGDPHAAQGDGEICVTAVEAPASAALRFRLHKGKSIPGPQFLVPTWPRASVEEGGYYATTGVSSDLMTAARDAARAMIDHLVTTYALEPIDAYVLSSVVVDLKITEIVDQPNWVVSAYLPLAVFRGNPSAAG